MRHFRRKMNNCTRAFRSSPSNVTESGASGNTSILNTNMSNLCNRTFNRMQNAPCHSCDTTCIYQAIEMILIIGIVANFLVVLRVVRDKSLRKPTFVTIACLALTDGVFLIAHIGYASERMLREVTCTMVPVKDFVFEGPLPTTLVVATWCCANLHITFMAIIRYLMLVHPIKCAIHLTNKRVIVCSVLIWVFTMGAFLIKYAFQVWIARFRAKSVEYTSVIWICVYLCPLVVTVLLHIVKLWKLHKYHRRGSSASSFNGHGKASIRRMTKLVTVLVLMAAILPLPKFVFEVLTKLKYKFPSGTVRLHYQYIAMLLFLLNNTLNPFVYAFLSGHFRRSIKSMCKHIDCRKTDNDSSDTPLETPLTIRRTISTIAHGNDTSCNNDGRPCEEMSSPLPENDCYSIQDDETKLEK